MELEGEGYFKVTKDERKPFRVVVKKQTVEVLGTEFNVDAYPGEKNILYHFGQWESEGGCRRSDRDSWSGNAIRGEWWKDVHPEGKRGGGHKLAKRDVRVGESYLGGDYVETGSLVRFLRFSIRMRL